MKDVGKNYSDNMKERLIHGPIADQWEAQAQHNIKKEGTHSRFGYLLHLQRQLGILTQETVNANSEGNLSLSDEMQIIKEIDKLIAKSIEMRASMTHKDAIAHETIVKRDMNNVKR